jgi:hypothetical protein
MNLKKEWGWLDSFRRLFCLIVTRGKVIVFWRQILSAAGRAHWTQNPPNVDYANVGGVDEAI